MNKETNYLIFERGERSQASNMTEDEQSILLATQNLNELCRCARPNNEVIKKAIEGNKGLAIAIDKIATKAKEGVDNLPMKASLIHYSWEKYKKTDNYTLLKNLYLKLEIADDRVYLATQMPQWVYVWRYVNRFKWANESEEDAIVRQDTIETVCAIILEYKRMTELQELECEQQTQDYLPNKKSKSNKTSNFRDIVQTENKDKLIKRLHELIDGKGGVDVGVVIVAAVDIHNYLTRYPHEKEFKDEFWNIKYSWKAIANTFTKARNGDNNILSKASNIVF